MVMGCGRGPGPPAKMIPLRGFKTDSPLRRVPTGRDCSSMRFHVADHGRQSSCPGSLRRLGAAQVDTHGELLPQFHTELIEGVHAPYASLHEHAVLVERDQTAECC